MWRTFALFEHYGRMTLTLDEIAEQVGLAPGEEPRHLGIFGTKEEAVDARKRAEQDRLTG